MKTAVMTELKKIEFVDRPIPRPGENEVLVKVEYVGVCGSDMHYFEHGRIGDYIVEPPFVLGHEAGGTVVKTGAGVTHLKVGDKVALEPGKTCGKCEFCRTGRYNLCPDVEFFATPPVDGVLQEYVTHDAALCFKIPEHMDTMDAALIEPLAVGFHAARQGGAQAGQTAVVMGAGCIGLVSLLAMKAMGVSNIYVVDIMQKRLEKSLELGASEIINGREVDVAEEIKRLTNASGVDLVIETAGTELTCRQSVSICKKGATVVFVGYSPSGNINLPMGTAIDKELTFKTNFRYRHVYPIAIEAVSSGRIDVKRIVTNVFGFDDVQNAFDISIRDKENVVKSVIKIS